MAGEPALRGFFLEERSMTTSRGRRHDTTLLLRLAFAALLALLPAARAQAIPPVERHDWVVGLAFGVGTASIDVNDESGAGASDWTRGAALDARHRQQAMA